jgi:hypothetical protein
MSGTSAYDGACECGGLTQKIDPLTWAEENLLASPGAIVSKDGELFRIPTLVPAVKPDGECINLTSKGLCKIHENAPFGCAFFDCGPERNQLSHSGLTAVMQAHGETDPPSLYSRIWVHLYCFGHRQLAPEVLRSRL